MTRSEDKTPATTPARPASPALPRLAHARNGGLPLDTGWIASTRVNRPAAERHAAGLAARRPADPATKAAWLLRAVGLIDLTTLSGDDTPGRVRQLCAKARAPLRADLRKALGAGPVTTAAVCVYHEMIAPALAALEGSGLPVAAVSTGFPAGLSPFSTRLAEIEASVAAGASEIDIVISRRHVLLGDWQALYDEVAAFRAACGPAHMKAILATGELGTLTNVARASLVAMMAGADFIKTSTGKEPVNATLPVGLTMCRMIRAYREATGVDVGFKPAGGISTAPDALDWLVLVGEELGPGWQEPDLFRFGASSLLGAIERRLDEIAFGAASTPRRHATG
ncbi:deoxyribose-phosphate aldolase [Rhodovulum sulfidophilum]|uniref:deoxyribose-phosphate aldolase n=1 Tax=Rhodovulum sulfidophilum TaxID=35806 RepID=UPI0019122D78|nr:deoxyribose-phosphate aldolase [Rhodovulum sulfidophilum]MBK5924794.1 deoxyribose-phosphate aldolase [Rhodovulum sulfidophilum]